jgi:hypothetical protein
MKTWSVCALLALCTALSPAAARAEAVPTAIPTAASGLPPLAAVPIWAERMQVVYDPETRRAERMRVRVADPHPFMGLDFQWEPDAGNWPGVDAEGRAEGPGRLVWRVPGTPAYDPRAVHHSFRGTLLAGRFEGPGTLRYRDGARREGTWRAGMLEGIGREIDAEGNRYEGGFAGGLRAGPGLYQARAGWSWEGPFVAGAMHGTGQMRHPGGDAEIVAHAAGRRVTPPADPPLPDRLLAGLLPAQGGAQAERTTLVAGADLRMAAQQDLRYTHLITPEQIAIHPDHAVIAKAWNGTLRTGPDGFFDPATLTGEDEFWAAELLMAPTYDDFFAFLDAQLALTGGEPVTLAGLSLEVERSEPHLQPMLAVYSNVGCFGHRPDFRLYNAGWGPVEAATARFRFVNPATGVAGNRLHELPIAGFDATRALDLRQTLGAAGVDLATLAGDRFNCPPGVDPQSCLAALLSQVRFGELEGLVDLLAPGEHSGGEPVGTRLDGVLSIDWRDTDGSLRRYSQGFTARISLVALATGQELAEMGAGGAMPAEAPDFIEVRLPTSGRSYSMALPVRGNPRVRDYTLKLKLAAERSSVHHFRIAARFDDGSVRQSLPIVMHYYRPRSPDWELMYPPIPPERCWFY